MKARLTITLDVALLDHVDRAVGRTPALDSRSAVIEEAVRRWSRTQYEAAIREYYEGKTAEERAEDDAWARLSEHEMAAIVARDAPIPVKKTTQRRRRRC